MTPRRSVLRGREEPAVKYQLRMLRLFLRPATICLCLVASGCAATNPTNPIEYAPLSTPRSAPAAAKREGIRQPALVVISYNGILADCPDRHLTVGAIRRESRKYRVSSVLPAWSPTAEPSPSCSRARRASFCTILRPRQSSCFPIRTAYRSTSPSTETQTSTRSTS